MSDILYSKLRLEVPSVLDEQNATITNSSGSSRTVVLSSPITDIMLAGMEKYRVQAGMTDRVINIGYGEIKKMVIRWFDSLENAPWKSISDVIKDGNFTQAASVGDTKTFILNGNTYTAEVVAINDGTGDAGQWYPANTVDFICRELYSNTYYYNSSSTNNGGFPNSALCNMLNGSSVFSSLPLDLQDVIIDKSHSYMIGGDNMLTSSTKLWIPTQYEITGATHTYAPTETSSNNKKYTLSSLIKKRNGQTSANIWWLGSVYSRDTSYCFCVNTSGNVLSNESPSNSNGVPLCFRIG